MNKLTSNKRGLKCSFCKLPTINEQKFGPLYILNDVVGHYYCILLAHQMQQNGEDEEGILGFLVHDIKAEMARTSRIICTYCQLPGASIVCADRTCKIKFHLPCGLKRFSMHQFMGKFKSFCKSHRPLQNVSDRALLAAEESKVMCAICYMDVDYKDEFETMWAPCCELSWFHRTCMQKLASSAGYYFKCPICTNEDKFRPWMIQYGIFIPDRDASWELVDQPYNELLYKHGTCDAMLCKCPYGKTHNVDEGRWEIVVCKTCGAQGVHVGCGNLKYTNPEWECSMCQGVLRKKRDSEVQPGSSKIKCEKDAPSTSWQSKFPRSSELSRKLKEFEEKRQMYSKRALSKASDDARNSCDEESKPRKAESKTKSKSKSQTVRVLRRHEREQEWVKNAAVLDELLTNTVPKISGASNTSLPKSKKVILLPPLSEKTKGKRNRSSEVSEFGISQLYHIVCW